MDSEAYVSWRPTKRQLQGAGIVAASAFVIVVLCGYLFEWKWTGLVTDADYPSRTLWDWLDLLIVPLVLATGGYLFTRSENQRRDRIAEDQRKLDSELADKRRQDDLLTDKDQPLSKAQTGDNLSTLARARTLTVLPRLDGDRKRSALQFLFESELISNVNVSVSESGLVETQQPVVDLRGADLNGAQLSNANLMKTNLVAANLEGADLNGAVLSGANLGSANLKNANISNALLGTADLIAADLVAADLRGAVLGGAYLGLADLARADLRGADLSGADLRKADLSGADLRKAEGITGEELRAQAVSLEGAIMPEAQKYEDWLESKNSGEDGENSDPS